MATSAAQAAAGAAAAKRTASPSMANAMIAPKTGRPAPAWTEPFDENGEHGEREQHAAREESTRASASALRRWGSAMRNAPASPVWMTRCAIAGRTSAPAIQAIGGVHSIAPAAAESASHRHSLKRATPYAASTVEGEIDDERPGLGLSD